MNHPCRKVGIETTWRCGWHCAHCFYRWGANLHRPVDAELSDIAAKLDQAQAGGLNHAVMVGYGEPILYPAVGSVVDLCGERNMACSMITNGTAPIARYEELFERGLDHLHISSHGTGDTLTAITGDLGAWAKQVELKAWLKREGLPYRANVTMQQMNFRQLPEIVAAEHDMGAWQQVILGFLPHYEWGTDPNRLRDVAVHPALLRPWIEEAAFLMLELGARFTIRYQPFCHLDASLWPYVTNARYVFYDPFEWNYTLSVRDPDALWRAAVACGESTACEFPCKECAAYRHCGGWNRTYAAAYGGAGLQAIRTVPHEWAKVWDRDGGLFDLNPVNSHSGTLRGRESC